MINFRHYRFQWTHVAFFLVFLFPLFSNTLRHWASSTYGLLALFSLISVKQYSYDLKKEERIFLVIIALHVIAVLLANVLSGWTRASHEWFFSGEFRILLAIPIYLYLRSVPNIWHYLLLAIPLGAIIIGLTGTVDFAMRYVRGDLEMILAEGIYGHIFQGNISALWSVLSFAAIEYFKDNKKMKTLCFVGASVAAVGALVSVTRNAWLSLLILYAMVFILQGGLAKIVKALGMKRIVLVLVAFAGMLYFLSHIEFVNSRFKQVYQEPVAYFDADRSKPMEFTSIGFRLEQWRGAIYAFAEKPFFGHGVGNSGKVHNSYIREGRLNQVIYQEPTEKYGTPTHVHNAYLEFLGDTGLVGFVLTLLLIFYPPYVAFRSRRSDSVAWKLVILHAAAFAIASLTEVPFIRNNWTSIFCLPTVVFFIWLMHDNGRYAKSASND